MYNKQMPTIDILTRLVIVIVIIGLIYFSVKRERFATACGVNNNETGCRIEPPCHCGKLPSYCDCKARIDRPERPKLGCHGCDRTPNGDFITREMCQNKTRKSCCSLPDMYNGNNVDPFSFGFEYTTGPNPRMITKF